MQTTDLCRNGEKFEWRGDELFLLAGLMLTDDAWVDSYTMEGARSMSKGKDQYDIFIINRTDEGDRIFKTEDFVVFAGGDVMFSVSPVG